MSQETVETVPPSAQPAQKTLYRIRLTYARRAALRYVSNLDMQLVWERMLRRARLPLAHSQGFNPRPRLHMASALPLGFTSRCEIADFWLGLPEGSPALELAELVTRVQNAAPPGLEVLQAVEVPLNQPALQTQVQSAEYLALPLEPLERAGLEQQVAELLAAAELPRERHKKPGTPGKRYDLRPLIEALRVQENPASTGPALYMRLAAREGATGRPEELLAALGQDPTAWRIERTNLIL